MIRCVQCDTELVAPERSEYWSDKHACHIWLCPTCSACFESLVSFSTDTECSHENATVFAALSSHHGCG